MSVSFNPNKKAEDYASFLGVTKSKVYKVIELYNKEGASFTENLNWGDRRSKSSHMSFEDDERSKNKKRKRVKLLLQIIFAKLLKQK